MINAVIKGITVNAGAIQLSNGQITVRVEGHSRQSAKGNDIVCAGVSALVQSAALALEYFRLLKSLEQSDGLLEMCVDVSVLSDIQKVQCESVLSVFVIGIHEMQKQYPEYIGFRAG